MAGTGNSDPLMDALLSESTIADGVDMLVDALEPYVSAVNAEQSDYLMEAIQNSTEDILPTIPRKRNFIGRPSLAFIPGVVEEVKRILLQAGAAASEKRRTQEYGLNLKIGISTVDLRDHISRLFLKFEKSFLDCLSVLCVALVSPRTRTSAPPCITTQLSRSRLFRLRMMRILSIRIPMNASRK
jgi:hypothetical protein